MALDGNDTPTVANGKRADGTSGAPVALGTKGDGSTVAANLAVGSALGLQAYLVFIGSFIAAIVVHIVMVGAADKIPARKKPDRVKMAIVETKPPPPPPPKKEEPKPEPKKEKPKPKKKKPKPKKKKPTPKPKTPPPDVPPPPSNSPPPKEAPTEPVPVVTGISMSSVNKSGNKSGFKVRVGNTTHGDPNKEKFVAADKVKAYTGGKIGGKATRTADLSSQAVLMKRFRPKYPRQLVDEGVEGKVVLMVTVNKKGNVVRSRLISGIHPVLDKLSQKAAKLHKYKPAKGKDGDAVVSNIRLVIRWEIMD